MVGGLKTLEMESEPINLTQTPTLPCYPVVAKVGCGARGVGKVRVENATQMSDVHGVVAVAGEGCTLERYIDSKYDIHIYKIGEKYNAYKRKGVGDHWKTSSGSAMLEQIPLTAQYRRWVDLVAGLFDGLDVCGVEALVDQEGHIWIYEANDCGALTLLGDSQEEDRRAIAELAMLRMGEALNATKSQTTPPIVTAPRPTAAPPSLPPRDKPAPPRPKRGPSVEIESPTKGEEEGKGIEGEGDEEDTMGSLKKTFAGIFGEI